MTVIDGEFVSDLRCDVEKYWLFSIQLSAMSGTRLWYYSDKHDENSHDTVGLGTMSVWH